MGSICLEKFFPPFDSKPVFIFSLRCVSCKQYKVGSCFLTQVAVLCLLIAAWGHWHSVLILRSMWCFSSFLFLWYLLFTYSLFTSLLGQKELFFLASSCLTLISSSVCKSPLSIFFSTGLVVMDSFHFCLLWNVLISPSIRKDSFAG
jgi:hypothetical protein